MRRVLLIGGTGSLGSALTTRFLKLGYSVGIFSRDEAKQHFHRLKFPDSDVKYYIGDVRDEESIFLSLLDFEPNIIINAAAMKQVPACEQFPMQAIKTNVDGATNVCLAAQRFQRITGYVIQCLCVSTDKAVKPVNAYGASKALQERLHLSFNSGRAKLICTVVRYGNVLESTGSVIPLFKKQLELGQELTITDPAMTRFLLSLDDAVDLILTALDDFEGGGIYVPRIKSAYVLDIAHVLSKYYPKRKHQMKYPTNITGIRPGEKLDEILIAEQEIPRVIEWLNQCFMIVPEAEFKQHDDAGKMVDNGRVRYLCEEYFSSGFREHVYNPTELYAFFQQKGVLPLKEAKSAVSA